MPENYKVYLKEIGFEKYFNKLKNKIGSKKVIIYGAGRFFGYIKENYDLSSLNIVAISDKSFLDGEEGEEFLGYKKTTLKNILNHDADFILIATLQNMDLIENFNLDVVYNKNIKVYPLARRPMFETLKKLVKDHWSRYVYTV